MKRHRRKLRLCESNEGTGIIRIDQCEEIGRTGPGEAAHPAAKSNGGTDAMRMHGSLFLSFQLHLDFNPTRTVHDNQLPIPPRSVGSSVPPSATATADSDAINVSASASRKRGCFRTPKPKSSFNIKPSTDKNNVSGSGVIEDTLMMAKRPRGRPRKDFPVTSVADAPKKRRGRPPKGAGKDVSLAITTGVPRRNLLNIKHKFLQGKINKAAGFLEAAVSAMREVEGIVAMDSNQNLLPWM